MRDYQKSKVYAAEHILEAMLNNAVESGNPVVEVGGVTVTLPPEAKFGSIESIQTYVDKVLQMPSVIEHFGQKRTIFVRKRKGVKMAHYSAGVIAIPDDQTRWALREMVVLHEIAHAFSPSGHGPKFVQAELALLRLVMGPEVELALRILFDENGVESH